VTVPDQEIESEIPMTIENDKDVPLLEWLDEDSDEEKFILVQSKKKRKRKVRTSLGSLEKEPYIRRSSRTTPSGHMQLGGGGRKILLQKNSKKVKNEFE
jgi:hypothetical protein